MRQMALVIMEMTPYHTSGCAALERECFAQSWSERMMEDELNNPLAHYFVIMDGLEIRGCGGYLSVCGEGELTRLAVAEKYRGNGLGRRLLRAILESARSLGLDKMTLEVRESNAPALALYQSEGFKVLSKRPGYYRSPAEDALILGLDIKAPHGITNK